MTQVDLVQKAVNSFGAATKAKLSNIAATGQREDYAVEQAARRD